MIRNIKTFFGTYPLFGIVILAAIVRLIFLMFYYYDEQWNQLLVDSLFHNYWALSIADGDILGQETFFRAPLYIYLLGLVYGIFGDSILIARIFGLLIGISSVYVTAKIALKLFGKRPAIIAGLIHAVYPIAIYFESELLVDSLFTLLFELSIMSFLYALDSKRAKWNIITGLIIGLAAITKPTILALVPLYIIWIFLKQKNLKTSMVQSVFLIVAMTLIILPVTVRNLMIADDATLIASSGGLNFYIGNNASADGSTASMPPPLGHNWQIKDINFMAEQESGRQLKPSGISNFWYGRAVEWITNNKLDFAKLYFYKLYLCFSNTEISNNRDLNLFFADNPVLKLNPINYALLLALISIALFFLWIKRRFDLRIVFVLTIILFYLLLISLFFINARYRLPVIPLMIILASFGVSNLLALKISGNSLRPDIIAVVFGMVVFIISFNSSPKTDSKYIGGGIYNQANYYLFQADYPKATALYNKLLALNDSFPDANLNLGVTWLRQGEGDSARYYFEREIKLFPNRSDGYANIASLNLINRQYRASTIYADSALALKPYHTEANIIKIRSQSALYDTLGMQKAINSALQSSANHLRINLEAGFLYSGWGLNDLSIKHLKQVLSADATAAETDDRAFTYSGPTGRQLSHKAKGQAAYQLGYIYGRENDLSKSIEMSNLSLIYDSSLINAYVNLINGYRLSGIIDRASEVSQIALNKFPDNQTIRSISSTLK